jgi:phosphatidylserine decarboxylase
MRHQYIVRDTAVIHTERFYGDRLLRWLHEPLGENARWLCRALSSARTTRALSFLNYDLPLPAALSGIQRFVSALSVDLSECLDLQSLDTPRKLFERKLRYWEVRPMEEDPSAVVSPCDARVLIGSFSESSAIFLKGKFFEFDELLAADRPAWIEAFRDGDFAIFRLTPDKYHYNHVPVEGVVLDHYQVAGRYHSCNPGLLMTVPTPYSKNARNVTIIDTEVPGGTHVGLVAMVEVVALMIGRIEQCYSEPFYDDPRTVAPSMRLRKGQPKSLYRPGSSTTVLIFQPNRITFCGDLITNLNRPGVESRFSRGLGRAVVETDVKVRSTIARAQASVCVGTLLPGKPRC